MGATNALLLPYPDLTEAADGPDALQNLADAVEDYFYDRILPAGITRWPKHHWGSGTAFPTTGTLTGDTYYHNGLACLMVKSTGGAWRQTHPSLVADRAARLVMSTTYDTILHDGFIVHETAGNRRYAWDGVATWVIEASPTGAAWTATTVWTNGASWAVTDSLIQEMGHGFVQVTISVTRSGSTVGVSTIGDVANTTLCTLTGANAKWLPVVSTGLTSYDGARPAHGYLNTAGAVVLTQVAPGAAIAIGEVIQLSGIYRLADPGAMP